MPESMPVGNPRAAPAIVPDGRFWAKLHPRNNPTTYHPLLAHSADVAAVLQRLLQPDSVLAVRLARNLGLTELPGATSARFVYLAALHDLGKVNHSFQDQWRPRAAPSKGHVRIVLESLGHKPLGRALRELLIPLGRNPEDAFELLRTAICHHGQPWDPAPNPVIAIWEDNDRRKPLTELRRLAELARSWSGIEAVASRQAPSPTPRFLHLFAGALTLADWIGSTQSAFPPDSAAEDDPHGYWEKAQRNAARACRSIGLTPATAIVTLDGLPLLEHIFPKLFGSERPPHLAHATPTPLQAEIASMMLPEPGSRVLVESETGSGKTEAAMALYARLRAAGRVGGLVFALPTRATASAMHTRVAAAVEAMYDPGSAPTLALAMGGDQVQAALTGGGTDAEALASDDPDTYPDPAERELVRWSSDSAKKFFAAEIVVGTLDQLLLGALAVKHAHLRLAAFSRHLLVVDELHSYDRYMAEVLQKVLEMTSTSGGVALLMSATLSDRECLRFGGLIDSDDEPQTPLDAAVGRAYPVISVCAAPGEPWMDTRLDLASGPPKPPLRWRRCDEASGLSQAVQAARGGARVCILRNTVKGARATVRALLADDRARHLLWCPEGSSYTPAYHSRYTLPDRKVLDAAVLEAYGRGATAGDGRILIATQVAEQSLDVDFDLLVTDLCPVDVLLQRMGRVWRHRERDELRPPVCRELQVWVIEPDDGLEPLLGRSHGGPNGWGTVYEHLGFLELTRRVIAEPGHELVAVPSDNRELIESVYHADPQQALRSESTAWEEHFEKNEGKTVSHEITAKGLTIRFDDTYIANADRFRRDAATAIRTRLGDDRVQVQLPQELPGIYDTRAVVSVDLPYRDLEQAGLSTADLTDPAATGGQREGSHVRYELRGFHFAYGPQGWEWADDALA